MAHLLACCVEYHGSLPPGLSACRMTTCSLQRCSGKSQMLTGATVGGVYSCCKSQMLKRLPRHTFGSVMFLQWVLSWALPTHRGMPAGIHWWSTTSCTSWCVCSGCSWRWCCHSWFASSSLSYTWSCLRASHIANELLFCDCTCILVVPHISHQLCSLFYVPGTALDLVSMRNSSCAVFSGNSKSDQKQESVVRDWDWDWA